MVKLDRIYKNAVELNNILDDVHLDFSRWYDKETYANGDSEYNMRENVSLMGKNSHGIWYCINGNEKYMTPEEAYTTYKEFAEKCTRTNGFDIVETDNTEDWIEDNEYGV